MSDHPALVQPSARRPWRGWLLALSLLTVQVSLVGFAANPAPSAAPDFQKDVRPFVTAHCVRCHGPQKAQAGFRIDQLSTDFQAPKAADQWKEVMDMVNLGEMPPKEERQPKPAEFEPAVRWIQTQLRATELAAKSAGGRIPMRRLNRVEFANTVRDLLHMDPQVLATLVEDLPGDGKAEGFDRLGVALFFDQTQIERTLAVAETIAARAIVDGEPPARTQHAEAEKNPRVNPKGKGKGKASDNVVDPGPLGYEVLKDGVRFVHGYGTRGEKTWGRLGNANCDEVVRQDGYYKIRVRAGASPGSRGEPIRVRAVYGGATPVEETVEIPVDAPLDTPKVHEVTVFLRSGPDGIKREVSFAFNDIADLIITTPENNRWNRDIRAATDTLGKANSRKAPKAEIDALTAKLEDLKARFKEWKGPLAYYNPARDSKNPPTIFVDWFEISGPVVSEWPPKSHKTLLFAGDARRDSSYVREIFARLLPRAYRRPVTPAEIQGVVTLVEQAQRQGANFHDAVRLGLARVLCSPGFLFIQEPAVQDEKPRQLTPHELASRLSYFLWSTMPDEALFALAESGRLRDPQTLLQQVDRMLDDPKSQAFVEGFAGQWLQVREFGSVMPAAEYRKNYDEDLEESSKQEVYAFFREVLAKDLPVTNFLDSNFVMVNERLARHYGIGGVKGPELRRVAIEPGAHRGGVLGMAGLMTLLADGTRTLPVRRAAWVKTQLFGDPPGNPPPNAGEIQPNAAGKNLTVRQRLEMHRNEPTCASCHAKLDPFGVALENYDAIGQWRTQANGEGFRGKNVPTINVAGVFPEGDKYDTLEEYKAGLVKRKDQFARNLTTQLLIYALTRPVGYADHVTVEAITEALRRDQYKLRTLVRAVVASDLFQTK